MMPHTSSYSICLFYLHTITAIDMKSANKWKTSPYFLAYATIFLLDNVSLSFGLPSTESSPEIRFDNFKLKKTNFISLHGLQLNYIVVNASISSYLLNNFLPSNFLISSETSDVRKQHTAHKMQAFSRLISQQTLCFLKIKI